MEDATALSGDSWRVLGTSEVRVDLQEVCSDCSSAADGGKKVLEFIAGRRPRSLLLRLLGLGRASCFVGVGGSSSALD